jgi:sigma-B regulation protein RsbU (phosphoserine phosphatase)
MRGNLYIAAFYMAGGVALFLLGLVILRENPRERINRVTSTMMFLGGLGPILGAFGTLLQYLYPAKGILETNFYFNFFYLWEFFFPQLVLFSLLFPREHRLIRRYPRLWIWIFLPHLFHLLVVLAFSSPEKIASLFDPRRLGGQLGPFIEALILLLKAITLFFAGIYQVHTKFFSSINLLYVIAAIVLMDRGFRALEDPLQKRQVRPVLWGVRLAVGLYTVAILLPVLTPLRIPPQLRSTMVVIALFVGTGSIAWAIVRHQFLDLRTIVRQGMVYSATTGLLLGAYLVIIRQLDNLVAQAMGVSIPYLDIAFVAIAVIFFQPLLSRMEELSERIFRRDRSDYRNVLQRLTQDITSIFEMEQLQEKIASTLRVASLTDRTTLLLRDKDGERFCTYIAQEEKSAEIPFHRNGPAMRLLAKAHGPTLLKEIEKHLDDTDSANLRRLEARVLIPISHGEELLGVLCLGNKLGARRYTFEDMATLSVLGGQMAIALVNAQLYQETLEKHRIEEELDRAREIQESLLPKISPSREGVFVSALSRPSRQVGGDYYDFVTTWDGMLGFAIGDVSGKGMPAALLMAVLQASFNAQAQNRLSVRETVSRVNAHITRITDADKYVTFFYGELNLKTGHFTYSNAGHNAPMLIRADGQIQRLDRGGLVLGVMEDVSYEEETVSMGPRDMLFLYTDGITEAQNMADEEFGEERLTELLLDKRDLVPENLLNLIFNRVNEFASGGLLQQDDTTMVVLQLGPSF